MYVYITIMNILPSHFGRPLDLAQSFASVFQTVVHSFNIHLEWDYPPMLNSYTSTFFQPTTCVSYSTVMMHRYWRHCKLEYLLRVLCRYCDMSYHACSSCRVYRHPQRYSKLLKGPYAGHIFIPRVQLEVVPFLVSNESPYFSRYNLQISASNQIHYIL